VSDADARRDRGAGAARLDAQKQTYLPKLVSGDWTGTMNLTEPQAGSDLSAVRTQALPQADGSYRAAWPEDLHHLWRARPRREHHPSGAGAHAGLRPKA
jgi:hypothetical protein